MKTAMKKFVNIPNNEVITYSFKSKIPASSVLSKNTRDKNAFKDIQIEYLIYLGQLCDDECTAIIY